MKKIIIIFFSSLFFLFAVLLLTRFFLGTKTTSVFPPAFPTPTPVVPGQTQITPSGLQLVSLSPENGAKGVDPNAQIVATFNRTVSTNSARFSFFPNIDYALVAQNNSLVITPTAPYERGIVYTYSVINTDGTIFATATFSAGANTSPIIPLTGRYPDLDTVSDNAQKENYPDVFLAGYTPYQTGYFSVSSEFSSSPSGHFVFFVNPHTNTAKQAFLSWLGQLGLTQDQIKRLEVVY